MIRWIPTREVMSEVIAESVIWKTHWTGSIGGRWPSLARSFGVKETVLLSMIAKVNKRLKVKISHKVPCVHEKVIIDLVSLKEGRALLIADLLEESAKKRIRGGNKAQILGYPPRMLEAAEELRAAATRVALARAEMTDTQPYRWVQEGGVGKMLWVPFSGAPCSGHCGSSEPHFDYSPAVFDEKGDISDKLKIILPC